MRLAQLREVPRGEVRRRAVRDALREGLHAEPDGDRGRARDRRPADRARDRGAPRGSASTRPTGAIEREVGAFLAELREQGPGRGLTAMETLPRRGSDSGHHTAATAAATSARRCTSRGRSPTSATSPACTASRKAGRARRSTTSSTRAQVFARARADDGRSRCRTSRSPAASRCSIRTSSRWSSTSASRGGQLKIETNGHLPHAGELRAPAGRSA